MINLVIFSPAQIDDRNYNIECFNEMSRELHVTVAAVSRGGPLSSKIDFDVINFCMPSYAEYKGMADQDFDSFCSEVISIVKNYDVAIWPMIPQYRVLELAEKIQRYCRLILWGIGVAASYNTRYDAEEYHFPGFMDLIDTADAAVFYSDYPYEKYRKRGADTHKMFVAPNTVYVKKIDLPVSMDDKNSILFVGSLYPQKRIDILLENYRKAFLKNYHIPDLIIIGEGDCRDFILDYIEKNSLKEKVVLTGGIYDEDRLSEYFSKAAAVISPDQAGLTVLKSMGYGVPFITKKDAITGGEIFNISDGVNGILFDDFSEIEKIILDMTENKEKYLEMGRKAKDFYWKCRQISVKARGLLDAVLYAYGNR